MTVTSSTIESLSPGTSIIKTLQKYGTVPIDFLARVNGRKRSEIKEHLKSLEQAGLIECRDERVRLTKEAALT